MYATAEDHALAAPPMTPLQQSDRISTIDVLRGFALLGILVVNIEYFSGPESLHDIPLGMARQAFTGWHAQLDFIILTLKWLFVEGKMRALFGTLFGAGTVLLTERIERGRAPAMAADVFLRRSMWLLLFGILHGVLIWDGDILTYYALVALLLLYPLRKVRGPVLMAAGLATTLLLGTLGAFNYVHASAAFRDDAIRQQASSDLADHRALGSSEIKVLQADKQAKAEEAAHIQASISEETSGYFAEIPGRFDRYTDSLFDTVRSGLIFEIFGTLVFGMGLYKSGFLSGRFSTRQYLMFAMAGYCLSVPLVLNGVFRLRASDYAPVAAVRWLYLPYIFVQVSALIANASLVIVATRIRFLRLAVGPLAAVGQTAFSNYIGTSVLCQLLFVWGPLKLYGKLEYYQELYVVLAIWIVNLVASPLWLRHFRYGPLEWAWRSLTYWQRQPLRRSNG